MIRDEYPVSQEVYDAASPEQRQFLTVRSESETFEREKLKSSGIADQRGSKPLPANKYHVSAKEDRTYNGKVYPSKKQADYAAELDLRVKAGEIDFYLEEVPFRLPGGVIHRLDFVTFKRYPQTVWTYQNRWIEVKGRDLPLGKLKRKQVEALYGITIEVI